MKKMMIGLALAASLVFTSTAFAGNMPWQFLCQSSSTIEFGSLFMELFDGGDRVRTLSRQCSGGSYQSGTLNYSGHVDKVKVRLFVEHVNGNEKICNKTYTGSSLQDKQTTCSVTGATVQNVFTINN